MIALTIGLLAIAAAIPTAGLANSGDSGKGSANTPVNGPRRVTAADLAGRDVTNTQVGKKLAMEAAERFRANRGIPTAPGDLRVYDLQGDGTDILVAPAEATGFFVETLPGENGKTLYRMGITTSSKPKAGANKPGDVTIQAGSWSQLSGQCFSRYTEPTWGSWIDHCYKLNKFSDQVWNNNAWKDVYALHHYATAGPNPNGNYDLDWAQIWNFPKTGGLAWADWSPKSDTSGNCRADNLTLTVNGVGISHPMTACETWDITKYTTAGLFANKWSSNGVFADREVGYGVEVYVTPGTVPVWDLYKDVY